MPSKGTLSVPSINPFVSNLLILRGTSHFSVQPFINVFIKLDLYNQNLTASNASKTHSAKCENFYYVPAMMVDMKIMSNNTTSDSKDIPIQKMDPWYRLVHNVSLS